ncbi:glycosyltransferase family 1 protein [Virgibacillus sp. C22-A2]|uniref:Glycosyltransferase family 1 protein n=1 Tax=Virgibacillus tibetensis TaxID=3042313 RepID=A0ABU6KG15_9BACI|nr:glycosyltransferase family 1 protein [Virgibacillus sp. C22-A2]
MKNRKPIRILQVVGAMNRAGTETMLMNIYRNINHRKIQFDFISYNNKEADYDHEIERLGGKIIKLRKTTSIRELYRAIKIHGPYHAVHAHTLFHCGIATIAALIAGVNIRISHAHTTSDTSDSVARKMYIQLMRLLINGFSTKLLSCSDGAGMYLYGKSVVANTKYSYFPNVIDYTSFLNAPKKEINKFKVEEGLGNGIVIGHIGRFIEAKNHSFLLDIMKNIVNLNPTIKLLLIGGGDLKGQVEEEAKRLELLDNIRFVGVRENISTILHSMHVFVFPSIYEGLGLVLLEAQASGVPCVVSEAIQPEADVGLGLVTTLSLDDGPTVWADKIIDLADKKERNTNEIVNRFEQSGYSLTEGISTLMQIYQSNVGEAYEKDIDRLL